MERGEPKESVCKFPVTCKFCSPTNGGEQNLTKEGRVICLPSASPFSVKGRWHSVSCDGGVCGRTGKQCSPSCTNSPCRPSSRAAFCGKAAKPENLHGVCKPATPLSCRKKNKAFSSCVKFPLPSTVKDGILRQSRKTGEFAWCVLFSEKNPPPAVAGGGFIYIWFSVLP